MNKLRRAVFATAGYNTISMGPGRNEFHPKKPRPGIEHYILEAGRGAIQQIGSAEFIDEAVIGNFMAARFCRQGHLAAFLPAVDEALRFKPCTRTEGACASGGLAVYTGIKSILAETAEVVLVIGVEVQNTVKAVYGSDILAGAAHYAGERKAGHAFFFPAKFDERAAAYFARFGQERTRRAMAMWYAQAVENARREPKAQEYHNRAEDLFALGMTPPNPKAFLPNLNIYDCSKVSDGASAIVLASEEGLARLGIPRAQAVRLLGMGVAENDITAAPPELTELTTTRAAVEKAYRMAGLQASDIGVCEVHDCFTISGLLSLEAAGFVGPGEAPDFVAGGETRLGGTVACNTTGGLIGFGHYTGGTGVRQVVDLWRQLTNNAGQCQVKLRSGRRYGMSINMGGNDKTVTVFIFAPAE
ncbi:MAG: 3-ketoacyl-CoA thiolase [Calditrichaeota bacterium]|nr:3-ketoacyl-CoA thiolase [Calditrichota bacterium]